MLQRKPKNHTVVDMYKAWCAQLLKDHPDYYDKYDNYTKSGNHWGRIRVIYKKEKGQEIMVMSYTMFRLIIEMYNKYAAEAIIHGRRFDLGSGLGYLFPARIERNFRRLKFDVISTMQTRKKIPDHPPIYYLQHDYCMVKWQKLYRTKNESVYTFITAKQTFRREFSAANKQNPVLKTNYKFIPLQKNQQQSA